MPLNAFRKRPRGFRRSTGLGGRFIIIALGLGVAACGASDDDPGPGGVTVGEARALNEAAAMLDANSVSADAVGANQDQTP